MFGMTSLHHKMMLNEAIAGLAYAEVNVKLFTNNFTPSKDSVVTDFTEANYTGYASQATVAMGNPVDNNAGDALLRFVPKLFAPTGTAVPNSIWGWFITGGNDPDNDVLAYEKYDAAVELASANDNHLVSPRVMVGPPVAPESTQ